MTIDEALQQIAEENPELREIIEEINRLAEEMIAEDKKIYMKTMHEAIREVLNRPLRTFTKEEAHDLLLHLVRHDYKLLLT